MVDALYDDFLTAKKIFWADVHNLLVTTAADKYKIVHRAKKHSALIERIYLSKINKNVVTIIINPSGNGNIQPLQIHAQDSSLLTKLTNLQSSDDIIFILSKIKNITGQAKLSDILTYGPLKINK